MTVLRGMFVIAKAPRPPLFEGRTSKKEFEKIGEGIKEADDVDEREESDEQKDVAGECWGDEDGEDVGVVCATSHASRIESRTSGSTSGSFLISSTRCINHQICEVCFPTEMILTFLWASFCSNQTWKSSARSNLAGSYIIRFSIANFGIILAMVDLKLGICSS
jgi:hypothetical protein